MKKNTIRPLLLLSMLATAIILACHYYTPVRQSSPAGNQHLVYLDSMQQRKYVILRNGVDAYRLKNITIDLTNKTLSGKLEEVDPIHQQYIYDERERFRYTPGIESVVLMEVHLYVKYDTALHTSNQVTLKVENIEKIEVIEKDKARSSVNTAFAVVGVTMGVLAVIGVIVALTKSSCPFISVYQDGEYVLQGETFGGAVQAALAREDLLLLPGAAHARDEVSICISNELKEKQYTDFADLWLVEHDSLDQVFPTPGGSVIEVHEETSPVKATLSNDKDVLPQVNTTDRLGCSFDDTNQVNGLNQLQLRFPDKYPEKPAYLVLQLRNAYWLEHVYGKFTSKFGKRYNEWRRKNSQKPAAELRQWQTDQSMPLSLAVVTPQGARAIEDVNLIGPLMHREVAVPIPQNLRGAADLQITITTGFMFWEIDKVRLTWGKAVAPANIQKIKPRMAIDNQQNDVLPAITQMDGQYLDQPQTGERAYLNYKVPRPPAGGKVYTVMLHTKGYYEPTRDYSGPTDRSFLEQFRKPGALAAYSRNLYLETTQSMNYAAKQ